MAGLGIRLFTDEMITGRLARELRRRGYDVESCEDAGRGNQRIPDEHQLQYATLHGRAILTFNVGDFVWLDQQMKDQRQRHAGIVVSPRIDDLGMLIRCVQRHLDTVEPGVQHDTLIWLDTSLTSESG